ncbi:MAG: hypothetical protein WCC84_09955 [Candidatus Cybelea sp.]
MTRASGGRFTGAFDGTGAVYPGSIVQPFRKYPYEPEFGPALIAVQNGSIKMPLEFYLTANLKI